MAGTRAETRPRTLSEAAGRQGRAGLGCGGVEEHQAGDLVGELRGEGLDVEAAEGVAGQHVGPGNVRAVEQRVQVGGDLGTVLWSVGGVAPASAGAVVHADCGVAGDRRRDPGEIGGDPTLTWFQDDGRAPCAGAVQVEPVAADVDQLAGRRVGPGVEGLPDRLVAATHRGERQHGKNRGQQPPGAPAVQLPADPGEHPDHEHEQGRRPRPAEHVLHRGGPAECSDPDDRHEHGRRGRPALRLVAEPDRQHGQQRPAQREPEQNHPGLAVLLGRSQRSDDQKRGSHHPGSHRPCHDQADPAPGGLRPRRWLAMAGSACRWRCRCRCCDHDGSLLLVLARWRDHPLTTLLPPGAARPGQSARCWCVACPRVPAPEVRQVALAVGRYAHTYSCRKAVTGVPAGFCGSPS